MARHLTALTGTAALGFLVPLAAYAAGPGDPTALSPHRAVYEITLDKARAGAGMSDLTGRMVYELTGSACEGFGAYSARQHQMNQHGQRTEDGA